MHMTSVTPALLLLSGIHFDVKGGSELAAGLLARRREGGERREEAIHMRVPLLAHHDQLVPQKSLESARPGASVHPTPGAAAPPACAPPASSNSTAVCALVEAALGAGAYSALAQATVVQVQRRGGVRRAG